MAVTRWDPVARATDWHGTAAGSHGGGSGRGPHRRPCRSLPPPGAVGEKGSVAERDVDPRLGDDAGMKQSITVEIAAPAQRVWEVLTDVERWPEWTETVFSAKRLDEGPLRPGSRATINQPNIPETEYVVTQLDPG